MPFRLKNVEAAYQRSVIKIFEPHLRKTMEVYLDNMIVKSMHDVEHDKDLRGTFDIL